jgi:hypothetical protein
MSILISCGALCLVGQANAAASTSPYYGRWTVDEERPVFSARGIMYKTIDVAPCGKDFCGVSVDAKGKCSATLFRFFGHRANDGEDRLQGHGKWGNAKKKIVIYGGGEGFELYLGDSYDLGDRSGNMPKFQGSYRKLGSAKCATR